MQNLSAPYNLSPAEVVNQLQTNEKGLSDAQVIQRLQIYGPNRLTAKKKVSALALYIEQFKNTLTLILIGSAFLILFIYYFGEKEQSDLIEAGLILAIVLMITILGFIQEFKAEKAIESLKKLLAFKAKVKRNNQEKEIDVSELVPGDIVIIEEGLKVPADMRLIQVANLNVNESSLTGESVPVNKIADEISGPKQIADQKNMLFSGTAVTSGRGLGVVIQTGDKTEIGKIARDVAQTEDEETPIQKRLDEIGKMIGYIILGICAVVFIFIVFFAKEFAAQPLLQRIIHSFIAAVALAVAAIPEGLPAVVTISLALGTQRMLKKNALVRKLNSVETLGSTNVICSDKTGTLTKGEMTIKKIYFEGNLYDVSGTGYETIGEFSLENKHIDKIPFAQLLQAGVYCNNAKLQADGTVLGDPTEASLLVVAQKTGKIIEPAERIKEIPFSSERKMMSVVIKQKESYLVYTKGAPEIILKHCKIRSKAEKEKILQVNQDLSEQALRNLAFAYKIISPSEYKQQNDTQLEQGLTFLGIQAMIDPPRKEVKPLIDECVKSGIRVIMITGDHKATAQAVAREIDIIGEALTGEDLDQMTDQEFEKTVENISIYARVNPGTKMRIVEALKKKGHIVAMTGDGVNDAPALKKADIGIAMGITGTDVAKEAADMVLLDDKFSTIISAIEEGRGIFHNIRKFVAYLLSCNIAEVIVVFLGVMFIQKLLLTAIMLLWINVVTDGIPAIALGLDPAEKNIMHYHPKLFQTQIISKKLWFEMISSGILLTGVVLALFLLNLTHGLQVAQGAAFSAIVIFELVNLYIIRSSYNISFFSNRWLFISILVTILLQVIIVYTPILDNLFEIIPADINDWLYIITASVWLWLAMKLIKLFINRSPQDK
jgi:Ca2+-transporting ATPase